MPAWFSKVFRRTEGDEQGRALAAEPEPVWSEEADDAPPRRVIEAPVLMVEDETGGAAPAEIRIKARLGRAGDTCTLLVDRPVLEGHSFVCPDRDTAYAYAPLAAALFDLGDIDHVRIHHMTVTVWGERRDEAAWEAFAREAGRAIREHLSGGKAAILPEVMAEIPSEDEIRWTLERIIEQEINPGIAAHSGRITLNRVEGNTVYITMGGGCQGCAMSSVTLRQGVEQAFREAVPRLGAVLDETDHAAGTNPYFKDLPAEKG